MIDKTKLTMTDQISAEAFLRLRESVGFQPLTQEQAKVALKNTAYISAIQYDGTTIGIARLLFDFCTDAYITDVIVSPDFQGCGLGAILVNDIVQFMKNHAAEGTRIACSLYANKGKEEFYQRFGFEKLPNDKYGYGMILEI